MRRRTTASRRADQVAGGGRAKTSQRRHALGHQRASQSFLRATAARAASPSTGTPTAAQLRRRITPRGRSTPMQIARAGATAASRGDDQQRCGKFEPDRAAAGPLRRHTKTNYSGGLEARATAATAATRSSTRAQTKRSATHSYSILRATHLRAPRRARRARSRFNRGSTLGGRRGGAASLNSSIDDAPRPRAAMGVKRARERLVGRRAQPQPRSRTRRPAAARVRDSRRRPVGRARGRRPHARPDGGARRRRDPRAAAGRADVWFGVGLARERWRTRRTR